MKHKKEIFKSESLQYFNRAVQGLKEKEYLDQKPHPDFTEIIDHYFQDYRLRTQDSGLRTQDSGLRTQDSGLRTQDSGRLRVLDVGCGTGKNLNYINQNFKSECIGIEPSPELTEKLNRDFDKRIQFFSGTSDELHFDDNSFELVICWSTLHWVHRSLILQSLGELMRVAKKYILIMDFAPFTPYRTEYVHENNIETYKMDYKDILLGTGICKLSDEKIYYHPSWKDDTARDVVCINQEEYESGLYDWVVRKRILIEKDFNILPIKNSKDFQVIESK
jgi:SAM-dependent methyltransferase